LSSTAPAADSFYVSGLAGYSAPVDAKWRDSLKYEVSTHGGLALFGAVGRFFTPFRAEVEGGYQTNGLDTISGRYGAFRLKGNSTVWSGLFNGYFDFNLNAPVLAYVTAGVGMAQVSIDDMARRGSSAAFNADDTASRLAVGLWGGLPVQ
jgi:opacity protein-like surface antigen